VADGDRDRPLGRHQGADRLDDVGLRGREQLGGGDHVLAAAAVESHREHRLAPNESRLFLAGFSG
jgi:hypothetical protein